MKTVWTLAREALGAIAMQLQAERAKYVVYESPDELGYYAGPVADWEQDIYSIDWRAGDLHEWRTYADEV